MWTGSTTHDYGGKKDGCAYDMGKIRARFRAAPKRIAAREDPEDYLPRIYVAEGEVPSLHWGRLLAISPSYFMTGDLLDYLSGLGTEHPLSRERKEKGEEYIERWMRGAKKGSGAPSEVLFRQRLYRLNRDGSNRAFCEDVIYVHDSRGVERYGEFRLEHGEWVYPSRARVYREDGSFSDAGRIIRVDGSSYLSLPSLGERFDLTCILFCDNPLSCRGYSGFFRNPLSRDA
jgi:hypothetical protein